MTDTREAGGAGPRAARPALAVDLTEASPPRIEPVGFLQSKLHLPPVPRDALARRRLIDMLHGDGRMILVSAPAGFGKSTLLAQWAAEDDLPVAWVTLDGDDSDPIRFWMHVMGALDKAIPEALLPPINIYAHSAVDELVCALVNQLCRLDSGVVLVLDDYHEIRSQQVDRSVERLIGQLPEGFRVVISTRRDPDLALSRIRVSEQLLEIRQRDLRFTEAEAADWLARRGIEAGTDVVSESLAITEGWPAAYTLIFGSGHHRRGFGRGPDHPHVAEYIRDEVVQNHDDDRPLLVVSAFCPQVCASLLEYTLEVPNGKEALQRLERSDVLFERVNGTGEWYRLHRLVAEYFLPNHASDASVRRWIVRAAEWYTANDRTRSALDILIRAGEHEAACEMINRSWLDHLRSGQVTTLRNDLVRIAPEVAERSVPFLVTRAWLHAHLGRPRDAVRDLDRAESLDTGTPLPDGCPSVVVSRAAINTLHAVEGLETVAASARRLDALIDPDSEWRPIADHGIGYASFLNGDLEAAQKAFDRVLVSPDVLLRGAAIGWSIVIDVLEGRPEAAKARFDDGAAIGKEPLSFANVTAAVVARAALSCADGRPIEAAADLEDCSARLGSSDPTGRLEVLIWLAGAEVSIGRTKRARRCLDIAEHLIDSLGGSEWHSDRLREIKDRMGSAVERNGRDPGLTDREQRVLQLLSATHLSQREIGGELSVSFNTIKSHVKAIYVKLGATSREEASQIARNQGLI